MQPDRFNSRRYRSWVKTSLSLCYLKEGVVGFSNDNAADFHKDIVQRVSLRNPQVAIKKCGSCTHKQAVKTKSKDKKSTTWRMNCRMNICSVWLEEILPYHRHQPCPDIAWKNSDPKLWPSDCWELVKLFQPFGCELHRRAEDCDATGLLSMIQDCSYFSKFITNPANIQDIKKARNACMHSNDLEMSDADMTTSLNLMVAFLEEPELKKYQYACDAALKIKQLRDNILDLALNRELELKALCNKMTEMEQNITGVKDDTKNLRDVIRNRIDNLSQDISALRLTSQKHPTSISLLYQRQQTTDGTLQTHGSLLQQHQGDIKVLHQRVNAGDEDEFRPASVVIAKDNISIVADDHLSVYKGEVIYLLEESEQGEWKAKTNDCNGLINRSYVSKIDVNTLREAPQIVTADLLPYCLSGTFSIFLEAEEAHFIYNKHGIFSKENIDITGCSGKQIIDRLQEFIWKNQNNFRFYIDDVSAVYCNEFLNSNRHINKNGKLAPYIPDWYHGYIRKEQAETILAGKQFGTFVVRKETPKQKYVMSVTDGTVIHHIPIEEQGGQIVCCKTTSKYESVTDLVEYCFSTPFSLDTGDEVRLQKYISRYDKDVPDGFSTLDPYWTELYLQALSEGTENPKSIRLMIVGHEKVGKTTLSRNLRGISREGITSTDGIEVCIDTCDVEDDGTWKSSLTSNGDPGMLERIVHIMKSKSKPDRGSTSITSTQINENVDESDERIHVSDISQTEDNQHKTDIKIQTNINVDTGKDIVPDNEAARKNTEHQYKKVDDTSSRDEIVVPTENANRIIALSRSIDKSTDITVSIWDFGGQYIYYATHQLFHSPRAVYLLVLDLSKDFGEQVEYGTPLGATDAKRDVQTFIKFWMQSIHTFVGSKSGEPPVILIGTHKDKIEELGISSDGHSEAYFERVRQLFDGTPLLYHIQREQFFFDNLASNKTSLSKLKSTIMEIARSQSFRNDKIPARWVTLEYALKSIKTPHLNFSQVCEINSKSEVPIVKDDEIRLFLMYHHFQGNVVYFNENELKEFVVLDPQWLIDAFKSIITSQRVCLVQAHLREHWHDVEKRGILRQELLEGVWKEDEGNKFYPDRHMILNFFVRLGIMSRCRSFDEDTEDVQELNYYHIPSLLPWLKADQDMDNFIGNASTTELVLVFRFESSYISPTIYHRTTAAAMGRWPVVESDGKLILYGNVGMYELGMQHVGLTILTDTAIELMVNNLNEEEPVKCEVADRFRRFIAKVIYHELNRFQLSTHIPQLDTAFRCPCIKERCHKIISLKALKENKKMRCLESSKRHDIDCCKALREWYVDAVTLSKRDNGTTTLEGADIGELAKAVGFNWELLGISLGIKSVELERIKMDHPRSSEAQIKHMLLAWQRKAGDSATIKEFVDKMRENDRVTIDWDIVKDVIDKCDTEVKKLY